jgi:regulator of cell morphogenesis and NO signaling
MHDLSNKTIREIALEAPLTTRIFESYKIDFCCGGRVPFTEACRKAGADPFEVLTKLETVLDSSENESADLIERKKPGELIDHIVTEHHEFTRREIERLAPLAAKVANRHGDNHQELLEIERVFQELADELLPHMMKEEMMLFPFIEKLEAAENGKGPAPIPHFGTVNNPIRMMCFEHDKAGDLLKSLRELSADYTTPPDACPSFKGLFAGLEDLERDLHRHIHLENNVLFPQAIEMERRMFASV